MIGAMALAIGVTFLGGMVGPATGQMTRLEMQVTAWTSDVRRHQPGTLDDHAKRIASMPWSALGPILEEVTKQGDPDLLLLGASTLLDIAVHLPLHQRPRRDDIGLATLAQDGQRRGVVALDPHIWYGRRLVDRSIEDARAPYHAEVRPHAIGWYRTVSAVLASAKNLADLRPHVQRSLQLFPDEAGILFDAGCYAETYASPMIQAAIARRDDAPSHTKPVDLLRAAATARPTLLTEAERHFRRAAERDPTAVEARARLGRVLIVRGRTAEAVDVLRRAAPMPGRVVVKYYVFLFLGAALEASKDFPLAAEAFRSAAGLFPKAQSPLLALSRLAAERDDMGSAREELERLLSLPDADLYDPWWFYHRGSGLDAENVYAEFASGMERLARRSLPAIEKRR